MKRVLAGIWWLGRRTVTVMGAAMLLALTVGMASTALAGTGVGARLDLGKLNVVFLAEVLIANVTCADFPPLR